MGKKSRGKQIQIIKKVGLKEQVAFTKHLSTMLKAGIPLSEAVEVLADQSTNDYFKKILYETLDGLKNGQTLSESLSKHKRAFGHFYISLLEVSEESGTLVENTEFLAEQLDKTYKLRRKIKGAMMYPSLIIGAAFVMTAFISIFILPQLIEFFDAFDVDLPLTTRILLMLAEFMKHYGILFFGGITLIVIGLMFLIKIPKVKRLWHKLLLKLPILGKVVSLGELARLSRNLGVLLKSGLSISKALGTTANTLSNITFIEILDEVERGVIEGSSINEVLTKNNFPQIPLIFTTIMRVGEKSGTLEESLLYLGDYYEDEMDNFTNNLSTIIEPFLLLSIGLAVGFLALAIVTPIYELTGSL